MKKSLTVLLLVLLGLSTGSLGSTGNKDLWGSHQELGAKALAEKRYSDAEYHFRKALEYADDSDDGSLRIRSLEDLGLLYLEIGRLDEAANSYQRALESYAHKNDEDHSAVLNAVTRLALLYERQGRSNDAERLLVSAMEAERAYGRGPEETAHRISELARFYHRGGSYDAAERRYREALLLYDELPSPQREYFTHAAQADSARLLLDRGNYLEAERRFEKLLAETDESVDPVTVIGLLRDYARLMRETGRTSEAGSLETRAAHLEDSIRPERNP